MLYPKIARSLCEFFPRICTNVQPVCCFDNRELKQTTTTTATRRSLNKRSTEQNNSGARAL